MTKEYTTLNGSHLDLTLSGSVAKLCCQIATTLFTFANDTKDIDDNLNCFATEISSFNLALKAVTSTIKDPRLGFAKLSDNNHDVWEALGGSIINLRTYLDKLCEILKEINCKGKDKTLLRQAIKTFELRLKKDSVDGLRSTLRTHQLSLNTALLIVQLYAQAQLLSQKEIDL